MTITAVCDRCSSTKEVVVDMYDTDKTFRMSDLLGENKQYIVEGKSVCKSCYTTYNKLIEKQKRELADFIEEGKVKDKEQI